ncbi:MAG: PD-(D/E)XK nuclease family protein [Pseudoflavonifractor sp.]|nr:PD-(D/E)XK nuclease family protein [Pseudoflavonifractor sp.]
MLKLLLGRAGTGKTTALLRVIAEKQGGCPQLLIVPEQHSHDMERRLCAEGGNSVSLYAEVLSFTRLASRVFSAVGGLAAPTLDAGGRLLLMDVALKSVSDQLKVYARPSRKPQFLTQLAATVDECKSSSISPEKLWEVARETEGETGDKFADLALICGAYEALTLRRGADPRDKLTRLAEALAGCRWAEGRDVYLDGFTDFTPQERSVLEELVKQARTVTVALTCDGLAGGEEDVFAPARRTARQLLALARRCGTAAETEVLTGQAGSGTGALRQVEAHLFDPVLLAFPGRPEGLELYRATGPYAEVERTAAELIRLARDEGYRWREMAVTARSMEIYGPLIDLIFPRYGVPVFLARMDDVLQKPVLALVTAALDTVAGDYRYEDVFRYLKTGLAGLTPDETDRLENYVLKWDIRGSRWSQGKPWNFHPDGYGLPWTDRDRARTEELDALRRRVSEPLEGLRGTKEHTGAGLALALYRFLEEIGLAERLVSRGEELRQSGEAALAAEYEQLWDILCAALEQCSDLLGETPMEWDEFARLFKLVLSQYQVGSIPVSLDRVTAGEMPRLAHKHCKVLFVLGADDGALPAAAPSPGLLADADRSLLASFGLESAPRLTDKLWREMTIVYDTCALPSERLTVSWPAVGSGGEERRPSFLVKKLRVLFPELGVVDERTLAEDFRLAASRPALELAGRCPGVGLALKALPEYAPMVERMERAAALKRGSLTRPAVEALYGRRVPMSASRMDKYKSCHFSYFMQYGLKARPRKPAGFQAPEYGTFVHYVLEHTLKERRGKEIPTRAQVSAVVEKYVEEELGGMEGETPRFRYLFRRLEKSVYAVVENVCQELARSDFQPIAFELGFGRNQDLPPVELTADGVTVSVSGFVDRVDGWEKDGKLYLRVVDYKTGRKSFDLTDVWNGLGLQMLLYLFTLREEGKTVFGQEIVPAGVLYLPARDAVIAGSRTMTEEERRKEVDAQLCRKGLVLEDGAVLEAMEHTDGEAPRFLPVRVSRGSGTLTGDALVSAERLGRLEQHTRRILADIAAELAAGNIAADPFWRGPQQNACQWCDYAAACQFREGVGGDRRRWLPSVKADEFWAGLETAGEDGHS